MDGYNNATICKNGHVVSKYEANSQKFCSRCGKETYSFCLECNTPIRGKYTADGVVDLTGYYDKPYYCHNCGAAYPWTKLIIENAVELLSLDNEINEKDREVIKLAIPDLIVESVNTPIAAAKYNKIICKSGKIVADSLRQLLVDVISETAKKLLFPTQ